MNAPQSALYNVEKNTTFILYIVRSYLGQEYLHSKLNTKIHMKAKSKWFLDYPHHHTSLC